MDRSTLISLLSSRMEWQNKTPGSHRHPAGNAIWAFRLAAFKAHTIVPFQIPRRCPPRQGLCMPRQTKGDSYLMSEARHSEKSFLFDYDEVREAMVLEVLNAEKIFPLYIKDKAGMYRISRTNAGKLLMGK